MRRVGVGADKTKDSHEMEALRAEISALKAENTALKAELDKGKTDKKRTQKAESPKRMKEKHDTWDCRLGIL